MTLPQKQGLYDPANEHENCGIGLIVDMKGRRSHEIVQGALEICVNLDHRGGCGCDPITGDGAGIFIQLPDKFLRKFAGSSIYWKQQLGNWRSKNEEWNSHFCE